MVAAKTNKVDTAEMTVSEKLAALYDLQLVDTEIDKIKILRGELPLEVQDLEDEIAGLQTRINNFQSEVDALQDSITKKNMEVTNALAMIKKYEEQQNNVRNNREFDSLSKEIEFQTLEIELAEKRKKEFALQVEEGNIHIKESSEILEERDGDLQNKKQELDDIVSDTQKEEELLVSKRNILEKLIEPRLFTAYYKIRENARNGLAVVIVERDACGGCFNKIPPQRQLDIASRKKIIVCEYCGRILISLDKEEE